MRRQRNGRINNELGKGNGDIEWQREVWKTPKIKGRFE
jgi:hypothetical protein